MFEEPTVEPREPKPLNAKKDPPMQEIIIGANLIEAVNFEALRESLENEFKGIYKALALDVRGVVVYVAENATYDELWAIREYVVKHDPDQMTAEQAATLELRRSIEKARDALKKDPGNLQLTVDWLTLEVMRLVDLSGPD